MVVLILFAGVKNHSRKVDQLQVDIKDQDGIYFTDQLEVVDLITDKSGDYVVGVEMGDLRPRTLEERVEANPFVKDAQVYRDLKGNVQVTVQQSKPIARVYNANAADHYIDEGGRILPINARHTARVPLLETEFTFSWDKNLNESKYGEKVLALLQYIEADAFWSAQIAHLVIKKDGDIDMLPQVTKQTITFGQPENIERKFSKLMTFYKEILPGKGWNTYSSVNLKFENQIICE